MSQILALILAIVLIFSVYKILDWFLIADSQTGFAAVECGFDSSSVSNSSKSLRVLLILTIFEVELILIFVSLVVEVEFLVLLLLFVFGFLEILLVGK